MRRVKRGGRVHSGAIGRHLTEGVPRHAHANGSARLGLAGQKVHALLWHRLACMQNQRVLVPQSQENSQHSHTDPMLCQAGCRPLLCMNKNTLQ